MLSQEQIKNFHEQGFAVVPGVISPAQVVSLRETLARVFSQPSVPGDTLSIKNDVFARHPELWWMLVDPRILSSLRSLLGDDFVYFPESAAHDHSFGGWHKDTTTGEQAGKDFHLQPDFLMVQTGFYLQDNGPYGGGLDVIPGSHLQPDTYVSKYPGSDVAWRIEQVKLRAESAGRSLLRPLKRALTGAPRPMAQPIRTRNESSRPGAYTVPSQAGDLVIFHVRLDHKASWPEKTPIPPDRRKMAIFTVCSRNNRHVDTYRRFLHRRAEYLYLKDHAYPPDLLKLASEHRITLG